MNKRKIKQDALFYEVVIKNLQSIRPLCHAISAITSVAAVALFMGSNELIKSFIEGNEFAFYITAFLIAVYPIWFLEQKRLNPLINVFAKALAKGHSIRLISGLLIIVVPFIVLTSTTSFVGSYESAHQRADYVQSSTITGLVKALDSDTDSLHLEREKETRLARKEMRIEIMNKYQRKLAKVPIQNKIKYPKWNSNKKDSARLAKSNSLDSIKLEASLDYELKQFDIATDTILAALYKEHHQIKHEENINHTILTETGKDAAIESANRLKGWGKWFGWIAALCVIISVVCAIVIHWLGEQIEVDADSLKEENLGIIANLKQSAINKKKKKVKFSVNDNSGDIEKMKSKLSQLANGVMNNEIEPMKEAYKIVSELEKRGITAHIQSNGKVRYDKTNS